MKPYVLLLLVILLGAGCLTAPVERADIAAKDRIAQVEKVVEEQAARLNETSVRWEQLVKSQSEAWAKQSDLWREQLNQAKGESDKWLAQSELWRKSSEHQSEMWRMTLEQQSKMWQETLVNEAEKTRQLFKSGGIASSLGLPTKTDTDGRTVIDWLAIGGAGIGLITLYRNWKNKKDGKDRHTEEEIEEIAVAAVEKKLPIQR